jgi:hypothetical protein
MMPRTEKPAAAICVEKQRLSQAFLAAVHEVTNLQSKNFESLTSGGTVIDRFDLAIRHARKKRNEAKRAYELHLRQHGC